MISLIGFNLLQQKQRLRAINCEIMTVLLLLRFLWIICALSLSHSISLAHLTHFEHYNNSINQLRRCHNATRYFKQVKNNHP